MGSPLIRISGRATYVEAMSPLRTRVAPAGFIVPCQPTPALPPSRGEWLHEIKHDGYRLMVRKDHDGRIRLLTRNATDWTERFPLILRAAGAIEANSFLIDGEACCVDADGVTSFTLLRRRAAPVILYAFDLLMVDGEDIRAEPIEARKARLAELTANAIRRHGAMAISDHMEGDAIAIFAKVCEMGLEGIVCKRKGSRYRSGPSSDWLKIKNPASAAAVREATEDWSK